MRVVCECVCVCVCVHETTVTTHTHKEKEREREHGALCHQRRELKADDDEHCSRILSYSYHM